MAHHIHPTALVDPSAQLGKDVEIGPFSIVGPDVVLEDEVRLVSHVSIAGRTHIGARTVVYPFSSLGHPPQDLKYHGEGSCLIIGTDNTIREYVTMQPGTEGGLMETRVGNHGLFMAGSHVAHDCLVGNFVVMANQATLAGHVAVGDHVIIGGLVGVLQFVRIGQHAIVGGLSAVDSDVIPYGSVKGDRAFLCGINAIGLKRRGFDRESIDSLRKAYAHIFDKSNAMMEERIIQASHLFPSPVIEDVVQFIRETSKHGICLPHDKSRDKLNG